MKAYLYPISWALFILFLSANPGINLPESFWDLLAIDKLAHAFVYGVLSCLLLYSFFLNDQKNIQKMKMISIIISSIYGILMEIMQYLFFPNRYFEFLDILANIIGAIIGVSIYRYFFKLK